MRAALVVLVAILGMEWFLWVSYWDELENGRIVSSEVTRLDHYVTRGATHHWVVWAFADDPQRWRLRDGIDGATWSELRTGDHVPFFLVPARPNHYEIGTVPRVSELALLGSLIVLILLATKLHDSSFSYSLIPRNHLHIHRQLRRFADVNRFA